MLAEFFGELSLDQLVIKNQKGIRNSQSSDNVANLGVVSFTGVSTIAQLASMYPLIKWRSSYITVKPLFTTSGTLFQNLHYHQTLTPTWAADRMFWNALTSSNYGSYVADTFKFIGVTFDNVQCYSCYNNPFYIHSKTTEFTSVTMTNINDVSYGLNYKISQPFFKFYLRRFTAIAETITVTNMNLDTYKGGCTNGRLFDVDY